VTRRRPAQEPNLFDVIEPDGTRTPGIFRATEPRPARRRGKTGAPHDIHPEELAALAAHARDRWASLVAAARARIDNPQEPPDA
jgi:hypothetical protein